MSLTFESLLSTDYIANYSLYMAKIRLRLHAVTSSPVNIACSNIFFARCLPSVQLKLISEYLGTSRKKLYSF